MMSKEGIMIELTEAQLEAVKSGQAVRLAAAEIGVDSEVIHAIGYVSDSDCEPS